MSVGVVNSASSRQGGIAVVFTVDPTSTGTARIFGGEGAGDLGSGRYDLSSTALSGPGGVSRAVIRVDGEDLGAGAAVRYDDGVRPFERGDTAGTVRDD